VALLRVLAGDSGELGLVLHVAHLHHGLRGEEADADLEFVRLLAEKLRLPFHQARVETGAEAQADPESGKSAETIEEAARRLRYRWFRQLMAMGEVDAVATAHTLDDQAETVLAKFLRGAWTEGFSGVHPVLAFPEGRIIRPFLGTTRAEIEIYLREINQSWREDLSNRHLTFTRNRIRHELLPLLEDWNPRLREHLAQMAELAREEEACWRSEVARVAEQLILPGRPVRGGGRAASEGVAVEITRLAEIPVALQRRVLRHAALKLGTAPDFSATEELRLLALSGRAGQKRELAEGLHAERTHRELRLSLGPSGRVEGPVAAAEYVVPVPGEVDALFFGIHLWILASGPDEAGAPAVRTARLRAWQPGDRARVRHSARPHKVKEVLERMKVTGSNRAAWPVLELDGKIVWMKGIELEPVPGLQFGVRALAKTADPASGGALGGVD
jgi:tRNA(Ile)-lysidine synthase